MIETHYKIRNRVTKLYSMGSMYNQWREKGKTFDTIGKLRSYLTRCMRDDYMRKFLGDFEIVEFQVQQVAVRDLVDIVKPEKVMELLKQ